MYCALKTKDFYFDLPKNLIANYPTESRTDSRLLFFPGNIDNVEHNIFRNLATLLRPDDLLVMNNTKVMPARFYGHKTSGGKVEFLVDRIIDEYTGIFHIKSNKKITLGSKILLQNNAEICIYDRLEDLYYAKTNVKLLDFLHQCGHVPLPPYIERADEEIDLERYQTVYAQHLGAIAAPTAGLHFDKTLLDNLNNKGIQIAFTTLHVGAGTFKPVKTQEITEHKMHSEYMIVNNDLCELVNNAKKEKRRVIAVGTTALRALESAAFMGNLQAYTGDTNIFIYPGYKFQICDGLITNFHLPESTLLMLVAAFIGYDNAMKLYRLAIENHYRFFSYGDSSLLFPST